MSIKGIALDHLSAPTHTEKSVKSQARTRNALFHSFFSDARKNDSATTIEHRKSIIEL